MKNVKIAVFVPITHSDIVREAIGKTGANKIGNYDYCTFSSMGVGRFRPNEKANPHTGKANKLEEVEEEKIEFICPQNMAKSAIQAIRDSHPYEEIAFDIFPLIEETEL